MSAPSIGASVRVKADVDQFGGAVGPVVGYAGMICEGAVYVALPNVVLNGGVPGVPFDPHEIEEVPSDG